MALHLARRARGAEAPDGDVAARRFGETAVLGAKLSALHDVVDATATIEDHAEAAFLDAIRAERAPHGLAESTGRAAAGVHAEPGVGHAAEQVVVPDARRRGGARLRDGDAHALHLNARHADRLDGPFKIWY